MSYEFSRKDARFKIAGESGEWRYSYTSQGVDTKYHFWRFSQHDRNRRLSISVPEKQLHKVLEVSPRPIDLTRLEAFRGM